MEKMLYAVLISAALSAAFTKLLIPYLQKQSIGQQIREEGNKDHYKKAGTPTMGGLAFTAAACVSALLFGGVNHVTFTVLLGAVGFGAIGFLDDYEKVKKKESLGLTEKQKLILQGALAMLLVVILYLFDARISVLNVPFFGWKFDLGIFSLPLIAFIVVATVNASNLTDGLDGLLVSVSLPIFAFLMLIGMVSMFLVAESTTSIVAASFFGALLGFLFFNSHPASIFMGDTGSMAIGGAIVTLCIALNLSLFIPILCGIYFVEALSVIIQVAYYKRTKKRIFLMSPIHHHFELKGYPEQKVTTSFAIVSVLLCLLAVAAL